MSDRENRPPDLSIEQIRVQLGEPRSTMTYGRFRDLKDLEKAEGIEAVPAEEREHYSEFKAIMESTMRNIATGMWARMGMRPPENDDAAPASPEPEPNRKIEADFSGEGNLTTEVQVGSIPPVNPNANVESLLEQVAGILTEQQQQSTRSTEYLKVMVDTLDEIKLARQSADRRAGEQAKINTALTWAAVILAAVSSISVGPVLIEFWRHLNG